MDNLIPLTIKKIYLFLFLTLCFAGITIANENKKISFSLSSHLVVSSTSFGDQLSTNYTHNVSLIGEPLIPNYREPEGTAELIQKLRKNDDMVSDLRLP